ncbi:MAG: hypothetical protein WB611_21040 [Stellaceae bacterium]
MAASPVSQDTFNFCQLGVDFEPLGVVARESLGFVENEMVGAARATTHGGGDALTEAMVVPQ